ncbi:glycogen synthase [bacterium]|nr:glycogen synthase [bacterium]
MKVLFVVSECAPIVKVGGLGDVASSLPKALKDLGVDVSIVLPFYKPVKVKKPILVKRNAKIKFLQKEEKFNIWKTYIFKKKIPVFLIENKKYISSGGVYIESDASSGGSLSEAERFLFFSLAALEVANFKKVSILHCHDWHVAIIPYLVKTKNLPFKTLLTIHNLAYQGQYPASLLNKIFKTNFKGRVNCLELGILNADIINTVSPTYAKEILTKKFGFGLEQALRKRKKDLFGILNGLDEEIWNPENDKFIIQNYSWKSLDKKIENKRYLLEKFFKKVDVKKPVISIVSRLAMQKGIDLIEKIFPKLLKEDIYFILLGKGHKSYENFFLEMEKKYPKKVKANILFDEKLAHQIYAGSDIFLMPSFFEPCGLGQQISMKYGTVVVARAVGGIKNTVTNLKVKTQKSKVMVEGEGFLFEKYNPEEFLKAIQKALKFYHNKEIWRKIQQNGMKKDFSWKKSAKEYIKLYKKLQ